MEFTVDEIAEKVVGLSLEDAEKLCVKHNYLSRVISENGNGFMITCELRPDRINLDIQDDKVVLAEVY